MSSKILFVFFIFLCSCGLRVKEDSFENIFIGTWQLDNIKCYSKSTGVTSTPKETYQLDNEDEITLKFSGRTFTLSVSPCGGNQAGLYSVNYDNQDTGTISFVDVGTNSGGSCIVPLTEINGSTPTNIPFSILENDAQNMYWDLSTSLFLQLGTGFDGSSDGSLCQNNCDCYGIFNQVD